MARPKRHLGQHFLFDPRILARIADATGAGPGDTVLEIGPGRGPLTAALLARAGRVVAIERDADLVPALRERFPALEVVAGDALAEDWHARAGIAGPESAARWVVTGNIPYNITSPLLDKALQPPRPRVVVFLVQREVADRLAAAPGSAEYGALTVGVQVVATVEKLFAVPAGAFRPPPKVDSAVVRLVPRPDPLVRDAEAAAFRRFVVGLFGFRRKQLGRALREQTGRPAAWCVAVLERTGLAPAARCETLSPAAFVALFRACVDAPEDEGVAS